jgi:hypothetical protein
VVVDGDPEEADRALVAEGVEGLQPVALVGPAVVPDVELQDVDRVEAEVAQAALGAAAHVLAGKGLLHRRAGPGRPDEVLRRDLRRDVDRLRAVAHDLADELLAVAAAVGQAVSMKFSPSSIARRSARSDSSSWAPIHCDWPIPQAP